MWEWSASGVFSTGLDGGLDGRPQDRAHRGWGPLCVHLRQREKPRGRHALMAYRAEAVPREGSTLIEWKAGRGPFEAAVWMRSRVPSGATANALTMLSV